MGGILAATYYPLLCVTAALIAVLLLRLPLRRAFGPKIAYSLWALVPLAVLGALLPAPGPSLPIGVPVLTTSLSMLRPSVGIIETQFDASRWGLICWAIGCGMFAVVQWFQQRSFMRRLGTLRRTDGGEWISEANDASPVVVGAFPPKIVLPSHFRERYTMQEQVLVLAHEHMHLIRRDPLANFVVAVIRSVLWFHPLVYLAIHYFRIDQELACDAAVLEARPQDRALYAHALLKTQLGERALAAGCCLASPTASSLKRRILMLRTPAPNFRRRLLGATAVSLSCLTSASLAWALQSPPASTASTDSLTREASDTATAATTLTDQLDKRVPEIPVQRTAGIAGDPTRLRLRSAAGDSTRLRLRGVSGISGNTDPIVILDGVRATNTNGVSPLNEIDPNRIERIEVMKGPSATTLYGPDAKDGAIIITTKKDHP